MNIMYDGQALEVSNGVGRFVRGVPKSVSDSVGKHLIGTQPNFIKV